MKTNHLYGLTKVFRFWKSCIKFKVVFLYDNCAKLHLFSLHNTFLIIPKKNITLQVIVKKIHNNEIY